jgi:endoglucanase
MDEVGFMVNRITDDGYLKISTVGGINGSVMAGRHVTVGDERSQINGVIASKAIHQKKSDDRLKADKIEKLYIDIGADSAEKAIEYADIGSFAAFAPNFGRFGKDGRYIHSKALDDRFGCALIIELMRLLAEEKELPYDVYFCFTVREEVGISGAQTAAQSICPDYAIVLETTAVADLCDVDDSIRVAALGRGGAISLMDRSTIYNKEFITLALDVAKENEIPVQVKKYVSGGNDAGHIHKSGSGVKTLALSAPTRYLHSPNCVACYDDYESMLKLLQKLILSGRIK